MHSATQILALKEWKVGFIKMFNHKPLLVLVDRSLLSYFTVIIQESRKCGTNKEPSEKIAVFRPFLANFPPST